MCGGAAALVVKVINEGGRTATSFAQVVHPCCHSSATSADVELDAKDVLGEVALTLTQHQDQETKAEAQW